MRAEALLEFRWLGFADVLDKTDLVLISCRYSQLRIAFFLPRCLGVIGRHEWE
jgi:hypothetical protein